MDGRISQKIGNIGIVLQRNTDPYVFARAGAYCVLVWGYVLISSLGNLTKMGGGPRHIHADWGPLGPQCTPVYRLPCRSWRFIRGMRCMMHGQNHSICPMHWQGVNPGATHDFRSFYLTVCRLHNLVGQHVLKITFFFCILMFLFTVVVSYISSINCNKKYPRIVTSSDIRLACQCIEYSISIADSGMQPEE